MQPTRPLDSLRHGVQGDPSGGENRRRSSVRLAQALSAAVCLCVGWGGCHANADDPKGQAKELADPVRRQNAISNLARIYSASLAKHKGDRQHRDLQALATTIAKPLNDVYVAHPEDTQNGLAILDLMVELRDLRTLDALIAALNWRPEVSEEHAVRAATALTHLQLPAGRVAAVVDALRKSYEKVRGDRPADNRLRRELILAIGSLQNPRAAALLAQITRRSIEGQNFLFQRLAAEQLALQADSAAVPTLIEALFLFDPRQPAVRMNDVAGLGLVRIGRPALRPALDLLAGKNPQAQRLAADYLEAVRRLDAAAAAATNVTQLVTAEACYVLGALGIADAFAALLEESKVAEIPRRVAATVALVRLDAGTSRQGEVRTAWDAVYAVAPLENKPQLLAAARRSFDPGFLSFFLKLGSEQELHPALRLSAVEGYSLLAGKEEVAALRQAVAAESPSDDGGYRDNFMRNESAWQAAQECDADLSCWRRKLGSNDALVIRKAATMLARLGRDDAESITALVGRIGHPDVEVRLAVIASLDHIATRGSEAAVAKIAELRRVEMGRSVWQRVGAEASVVEARLRLRAQPRS